MPVETIENAPQAQRTYRLLRQRVARMAPGVPLPPVPELMQEMDVSQATIDKAYRVLEHRGMIVRKPRKGVFVTDWRSIGEMAIVMTHDLSVSPASNVYGQTCGYLRDALYEANPKWQVKLHLGISKIPGTEFPRTLDLMAPEVLPRLRGVFTFHPLYELATQLTEAGVPLVQFGSTPLSPYRVWIDGEDLVRQAVGHLVEVGCRDICMLHSHYEGTCPPSPHFDQLGAFRRIVAAHGLTPRDASIAHSEGGWTERHGYELFMDLWQRGARPDGIFVGDDVLCRGVLRAILQLGVDMPGDLRLITHGNRGLELPYHLPVSRVECDAAVRVRAGLEMMTELLHERIPEPNMVLEKGTLIKGQTT